MSWELLKQWGNSATQVEPLLVAWPTMSSVRIDGKLAVGRLGTRSNADLDWEMNLLAYLNQNGRPFRFPSRQRMASCLLVDWSS